MPAEELPSFGALKVGESKDDTEPTSLVVGSSFMHSLIQRDNPGNDLDDEHTASESEMMVLTEQQDADDSSAVHHVAPPEEPVGDGNGMGNGNEDGSNYDDSDISEYDDFDEAPRRASLLTDGNTVSAMNSAADVELKAEFSWAVFFKQLFYHVTFPLCIPIVWLFDGHAMLVNMDFWPTTAKKQGIGLFCVQMLTNLVVFALVFMTVINPPGETGMAAAFICFGVVLTHRCMVAMKHALSGESLQESLKEEYWSHERLRKVELISWNLPTVRTIDREIRVASANLGVDLSEVWFVVPRAKSSFCAASLLDRKRLNINPALLSPRHGSKQSGPSIDAPGVASAPGGEGGGAKKKCVFKKSCNPNAGLQYDVEAEVNGYYQDRQEQKLQEEGDITQLMGGKLAPLSESGQSSAPGEFGDQKDHLTVNMPVAYTGEIILDEKFKRVNAQHFMTRLLREMVLKCPKASQRWRTAYFWGFVQALTPFVAIAVTGEFKKTFSDQSTSDWFQMAFSFFLTVFYGSVLVMFLLVGIADMYRRYAILRMFGSCIDPHANGGNSYRPEFIDFTFPSNITAWYAARQVGIEFGSVFRRRLALYQSLALLLAVGLVTKIVVDWAMGAYNPAILLISVVDITVVVVLLAKTVWYGSMANHEYEAHIATILRVQFALRQLLSQSQASRSIANRGYSLSRRSGSRSGSRRNRKSSNPFSGHSPVIMGSLSKGQNMGFSHSGGGYGKLSHSLRAAPAQKKKRKERETEKLQRSGLDNIQVHESDLNDSAHLHQLEHAEALTETCVEVCSMDYSRKPVKLLGIRTSFGMARSFATLILTAAVSAARIFANK